ncbi:dynamin family protein [Pseudoalteromonas lipolytica]|uniref:Dynamin family protein n=1 Tax=Pseudoalteromonas lipolytica TaxID=570156 RepID=A0ABY1GED4_9GAMM|nr:dynamin family protein [Pseudoalteromonas lipolytica]MBE0352828.1 hypothetical protein [Pseudoalteromonas lipolytica LMEB 39]SFT41659.1 Dynamin family protein [Pseudoalteromonas lipolytica]
MSTDLDFDSLMNGHIDTNNNENSSVSRNANEQSGQTHASSQNTRAEGVNQYLYESEKGLSLCAQLIANGDSNTPVARLLAEIKHTIEHDFLLLAKQDDNTTGAYTYAQLLLLEKKLNEIAAFPHLEKYYTVAVGGSFSAGKSRFLNSVLGCPSLLPTDTTPTTSIPTYLSLGEHNAISALNFYRKETVIDEEALKAICHAFNERFGVTFSHLLQLISVEREDFKYPNLVFLDTPGYSKADDIVNTQNNTDENIAREHLRSADYLIWLVDQQNGTVPQQDIEFLKSLELTQPVLVVISKADKKPESQIQQIINTAKQDLQRAEINFLDVIGYSAQLNKEFSSSKTVLTDLLQTVSKGKNGSVVSWQAAKIFNSYINFYESSRQILSLTNGTIKELIFAETISDKNKQHLDDINNKTKAQLNALATQKQVALKIQQQLQKQITQLCELLNVKTTMQPSSVALSSSNTTCSLGNDNVPQQSLVFEALVQGSIKQLSAIADITALQGRVIKLSAVGVHIKIDEKVQTDFDIIITRQKIKAQLGAAMIGDYFSEGLRVIVHIVNEKKASITVDIASA